MQKMKIAGSAVLALLVLIIVLQNTEAVETRLLFFSISMPRAALLFGTLVIGYLAGVFTASGFIHLQRQANE